MQGGAKRCAKSEAEEKSKAREKECATGRSALLKSKIVIVMEKQRFIEVLLRKSILSLKSKALVTIYGAPRNQGVSEPFLQTPPPSHM
jgi:hypothetical protein